MSSTTSGRPAPATSRSAVAGRRDFVLVLLASVAAAIVCAKLNVSEALLAWAQPRERFQVDELPAILLVFALCMVWFSVRRYREACRELERRQQAEQELRAALATNRRLARQYVEIQESERRALARDLHDELGQHLNAMKIDAVALRDRLAVLDGADYRTAAETVRGLDAVQALVMGLIRQLRPVGLDELGLTAALEHCIDEWRRRLPQISMQLSMSDSLDGLDEMRRLALYRLVQEALTNVARHSRATHVRIRISRERAEPAYAAEHLLALIEDNGVGADLTRMGAGLGLIGMRERLEAVGGALFVRNSPAGGFTLCAHIPLAAAA